MTRLTGIITLLACFLWGLPCRADAPVKVGAQVLNDSGYGAIAGRRVGLITNHTARVNGSHLVDLMHASGRVRLAALFAPEHGLRGMKEDGIAIGEKVDELTGAPVYSLYGKARKPTPEMLNGLDVLLFDIQGIGVRFYTYISTMGLAMQAAAAAHIPFLVLDRPNPLGGEYIAGPVLKKEFTSFVGEYPIPVTHGMTSGELALMIKGERMLPGLEGLDLRVVRMEGWRRGMQWPETGLDWVRTSPNIPDFETALLYPGICLVEGTAASEGRGTREPFRVVGFPGIDAGRLAQQLNDEELPGVRFVPAHYTPRSIPGMSSAPKFRGRDIPGVRLMITDHHEYRSVETGIHLLCALYDSLPEEEQDTFFRRAGFDLLAGSESLRRDIEAGTDPADIIADWQREIRAFSEIRRKYLLY